MEDQIITEQIDVIVVGDRMYELINLMINQELVIKEQRKKRTHSNYLEILSKMITGSTVPRQSQAIAIPSSHGIAKFTKIILTQSFWLHIHFIIHDNKLFDPFLFDSIKGSVSICIIASSERTDLTETKTYLHQNSAQSSSKCLPELILRDQATIVKPETVIEGKIFSMMHEVSVSGFTSVLALKITDERRVIEESSNLRLTANQISRWIVDRHFQNKHKIKIKEQLGDEIENFEEKAEKSYCSVM